MTKEECLIKISLGKNGVERVAILDEYVKQEIIDFENWKRRQGILFMQRNFTTPPEQLYSLYQQSKQAK